MAPTAAKGCAAIIDTSITPSPPTGAPDDFQGMLNHAVSGNIDLSEHAERVLYALLHRLSTRGSGPPKGILGEMTVACALITQSVPLRAAKDSFAALPTVVNLSVGTHVGPHDGSSPLEDYISQKVTVKNQRFLLAAAGNDGGKGVAASRALKANEKEFLTLRTGPRCAEMLVEIWWDDARASAPADG